MNIHFEGDYLYLVGNVDFYLDESDYANDNIVPTTLQSKKQGIRTGVARVNLTSATIKIDPLLPDFGLSPRYWKDNSNNVCLIIIKPTCYNKFILIFTYYTSMSMCKI